MLRPLLNLLKSISWLGILETISNSLKSKEKNTSITYREIRPALLNDANLIGSVRLIRKLFTFIPGLSSVAPVLALGEVGAQVWKRLALTKQFDQLTILPIDPLIAKVFLDMTPETSSAFPDASEDLACQIYSDLQYITDAKILSAKYPQLPVDFLTHKAEENLQTLKESLDILEKQIIKIGHHPEVDIQIRTAFDAIRQLFPALQSWALLNSIAFDQVISILDAIV